MATLDDFRLRVAAKLSLTNDPAADQPLIDSSVNEAVVDVLLRTRARVEIATAPLTANEGDYELPLDESLQIVKVEVTSGGIDYDLVPLDLEQLRGLRRGNPSASSPPRRYAVAGSNLLLLYPVPSASDDVLKLHHVPRPAPLSAGSDDPSTATYGGIPTEFHKAIEYYALWQGADVDDDGSSAQGERYRILYEGQNGDGGELAKIRRFVRARVGRRPSLKIGPPRSLRVSELRPGQTDV